MQLDVAVRGPVVAGRSASGVFVAGALPVEAIGGGRLGSPGAFTFAGGVEHAASMSASAGAHDETFGFIGRTVHASTRAAAVRVAAPCRGRQRHAGSASSGR